MVEIQKATVHDIPTIQSLSDIVWPITFAEILSPQQIKYMMDRMYSTESLTKQMTVDKHHYILVKEGEEYLGYLAYQLNINNEYTKIHKIYILPTAQGKGIGKILINHTKHLAMEANNKFLYLNVNRFNKALDFYQHIGFVIDAMENIDIGEGFLMEDYVMKMEL